MKEYSSHSYFILTIPSPITFKELKKIRQWSGWEGMRQSMPGHKSTIRHWGSDCMRALGCLALLGESWSRECTLCSGLHCRDWAQEAESWSWPGPHQAGHWSWVSKYNWEWGSKPGVGIKIHKKFFLSKAPFTSKNANYWSWNQMPGCWDRV